MTKQTQWPSSVLTAFLVCWLASCGLSRLFAAGTGLTGEYFSDSGFASLKFSRVDPTIDFDWGPAAPTNTMNAGAFSVRWSGQIEPRYSETYNFYVSADNGARLWINDRLVLARTTYSAAAFEMTGRINLQAGKRYDVTLELIKTSGTAQARLEWASPSQGREVLPQSQLYPILGLPECGAIRVEHWLNLSGTNVIALTSYTNYPDRPDAREYLTSFECLQTNWADNYGTRASGFILAPTNGTYLFAVAGDDATQLFLSTDTNAANKQLIASNNIPTGFRQYTSLPGQISAPITLVSQQKYYVELLHKESTGSDHFSVAWQMPGAANFVVIPAEALVPNGLHLAQPAQSHYLDTLCPSHPRLLASPERFQWLKQVVAAKSIAQINTWWGTISNSASSILSQSVCVYPSSGDMLSVSRTVLDRIYKCSVVYKVTGNTLFAERAWTELQQVSSTNFPDWDPPHFLDTAEMTHACSVGYDWLYDYWTQSRRDTIRTAIINKGLNQVLTLYTNNSGWVASSGNNWNLVCNSGMVLGALAVGTENEPLSEYILSKGIASASQVMRHYTTDNGCWYEGPAYWDYSTDYSSRMMAGLESALGSDFSLSDTRGLSEAGLMPMYLNGPTRVDFNFSDAGAGTLTGAELFWVVRRYNRPEVAWYERFCAYPDVMDLVWYDGRGQDPFTGGQPTDNYFRGPTGTNGYYPAEAVTLRSRWQDSLATFVGLKTGNLGEPHGDLDAGSFVLDALGVRWAHDLGDDDYSLPGYFSDPQRWTYYRMRAEGHNTLVINPSSSADQVVGSKPPIILYTSEPSAERGAVVADLSSAYGITKAWRGIQLFNNRKWVLVQDELQAATPANVWWFMHINPSTTAVIAGNGLSATLTQSSKRLWLSILSGGGSFALSNAVPLPSSPNPSGQDSNSGYHKLAIHLTNVTNTTLAVLMVPLATGDSVPTNLPALTPLRDWGASSTNSSPVLATNTPPSAAGTNLTTTVNAFVDVDLRKLAQDAETPTTNLLFALNSPANGTVTLLADGHTARFTPLPDFAGLGSFKFTATDTWPDPRLLAYYNFEPPQTITNGFVLDQSGNGLYGQLTTVGTGTNYLDADTPTVLMPGSFQSLFLRESGDFNGSRLVAPVTSADLDFNYHDWTLAGWFKRTTITNDDFVFYLGDSDGFGAANELHLYCPNGKSTLEVRHYIGELTTDLDLTATNIGVGQWHHAALTFQSTNANIGIVKFYVDGALAGTGSNVTFNLPSDMSCIFGGHEATSFALTRWFNGRLDDLAVFSGALSAAEVAQIAAHPVANLGGATATNTVWVNVLAPNHPPVLAPISNQTIMAGATLTVTNNASDTNSPPQSLAFSLLAAPAGAAINATNGLIAWRPPIALAGSSNLMRVVVTQAGWLTNLAPVADAYVRDVSYAGSNFGSDITLAVKLSATPGLTREAYLRFDLTSLIGSLSAASLRLMPVSASFPGTNALAVATNDSWGEGTLTWSNKPGSDLPSLTWIPQTGLPTALPVTPIVQSALASDRTLSLRVYATNSTSDGLVTYGSRESLTNAPVLSVTMTNSGQPALSATQSFWVSVTPPPRPTLSTLGFGAGQLGLTINGASGPDYVVQGSTNLSNWLTLFATNSPALPFDWLDPDTNAYPQRFYRVQLSP